MKFSATLILSVLAFLPAILVEAAPQQAKKRQGQNRGNRGQNRGQNGQNRNNNQQGQNGQNNGQNNGGKGQNNAGNGQGAGGDPQKSLTLDPRVIAKGFTNNGQSNPDPGQVASLTSSNNFINFCAQTIDKIPITDGKQIKTGSCNPAPIGLIPSVGKMPSLKFTNPRNGATIKPDTPFTVSMVIKNLVTGNFVNAQQNYFAAPQQLDASGTIIGHSHVVIEKLTSLDQTQATDPTKFAFFKGLNEKAKNGVLSAAVDKGVPAGAYRMCSINSSANHQPVIVPVAQHGSLDDCVYFTAGNAGNNGQNGGQNGQQNNGQKGGQNNNGQQIGQNNGQEGGQNNGQKGGQNNGQKGQTNNGQKGQTNNGQKSQTNNGQKNQNGQKGTQTNAGQKGQQGGQKNQNGQKNAQAAPARSGRTN